MKEETRKVVVLDWEDEIELPQVIKNLEQVSEAYQSFSKELTAINDTPCYLKKTDNSTENMSDYSNMSIKDLEELKENLLNQKSNLNNTIEEVINNIRFKKIQAGNKTIGLNPYYKDKATYLKVVISDGSGYIVTKVTPSGKCLGIYQFLSNTIEFLKYYEMCSKSEWEDALNRLNMWFKDASLKVKKL